MIFGRSFVPGKTGFTLVLLLLQIAGCHGYSATGGPGPLVKDPLSVEVMPEFIPLTVNEIVVYPLEPMPGADVSKDVAAELTDALVEALQANSSVDLLNLSAKEQVSKAVSEAANLPEFLGDKAARVARSVSAQGVIYGYIQELREREGSGVPAVGFKLFLLDGKKPGTTLWVATFQTKDQVLTENLFRIKDAVKKPARGSSPQLLAREGFRRVAVRLEGLRVGMR